jgi:hypothetical protein
MSKSEDRIWVPTMAINRVWIAPRVMNDITGAINDITGAMMIFDKFIRQFIARV